MKFELSYASNWSGDNEEIEINTLEELIDFIKEKKESIIMNERSIMIYDNYVE